MARGSENEKLDDNSIERVMKYLREPKATKKIACQMLNISYNTSRLDKLIEQYIEKKVADAKRRAEKRGKPATEAEVAFVISEYLEGNSIDGISKSLFRGTTFVKSILDKYAVPERNSSPDYWHPKLIPEEGMRERFKVGEKVWSAKYDCLVEITKELFQKGLWVYQIYMLKDMQYGYQPAHELASLDKLREAGVRV